MSESIDQRAPLAPATVRPTYSTIQNHVLTAWKHRTDLLPAEAKAPGIYVRDGKPEGPYPICLPREFAAHNLLPSVREGALALYVELDIPWHDGVDGGPSNHLRDSQVQCTNALFAMVADPERIMRAFGDVVDIDEVLQIEDGRYLTFEFIGDVDYFGEGRGKPRRRGTNCTSVDAAFLHRTSAGAIELALVEWKYTESYLKVRKPNPGYDATRRERYESTYLHPGGPLHPDVLDFEWLLDEPFYQLMRQQLLAFRLEQDAAYGASAVRVLHVLSPDNAAYQQSLIRHEHRALGSSVDEVWSKLLRSDRFTHVDPAVFLDEAITSAEYVDRYLRRSAS